MTDERLAEEIEGLKTAVGDVGVANGSGGQKLGRIAKASLPKGCSPEGTAVLLVFQNGQPRPQLYVKTGIRVPGGITPRSTSSVAVEGEEWMQFSYSFTWEENAHTLVQFVGAA